MGTDRGGRQPAVLAPTKEPVAGPGVRPARVRVAAASSPRSAISAGTTLNARWSAVTSADAMVAGSWSLGSSDASKMGPYPDTSRMIKDVIMREIQIRTECETIFEPVNLVPDSGGEFTAAVSPCLSTIDAISNAQELDFLDPRRASAEVAFHAIATHSVPGEIIRRL